MYPLGNEDKFIQVNILSGVKINNRKGDVLKTFIPVTVTNLFYAV